MHAAEIEEGQRNNQGFISTEGNEDRHGKIEDTPLAAICKQIKSEN